jgi:hypothetical protein
LAILLREICQNAKIYTFNHALNDVPARRGFALRDYILKNFGGCTRMWSSIKEAAANRKNDVMVVITDEQTEDRGSYADANADLLVIINVASYQNGVGYEKGVVHINGWSDGVINYIRELVKEKFYDE